MIFKRACTWNSTPEAPVETPSGRTGILKTYHLAMDNWIVPATRKKQIRRNAAATNSSSGRRCHVLPETSMLTAVACVEYGSPTERKKKVRRWSGPMWHGMRGTHVSDVKLWNEETTTPMARGTVSSAQKSRSDWLPVGESLYERRTVSPRLPPPRSWPLRTPSFRY